MSKSIISGELKYMQFISTDDSISDESLESTEELIKCLKAGTVVRVRYNQDKDLYSDTDVQVYSYEAKEGKGESAKTVTRYAVPIADAVRARRATAEERQKSMIKSLQAEGLTAEQILAKLVG